MAGGWTAVYHYDVGDIVSEGSSLYVADAVSLNAPPSSHPTEWHQIIVSAGGIITRKNSTGTVFTRSRLNLIEGANVTITMADDAGNNEVDVTIAAATTSTAVAARKNSAGSVFTRSKFNLIEGANVTLTVADDAGGDEIDVTIAVPSLTVAGLPAATAATDDDLLLLYDDPGGSPTTKKITVANFKNDDVQTFSRSGVLTVAAGTHRFRFPFAAVLLGVASAVGTAPTGAAILVDVHKNGTTVFTTQGNRPSIAISGNLSSETVPDVIAIAAADYLTVDVDAVGSGVAGQDLTVMVRYRRVS